MIRLDYATDLSYYMAKLATANYWLSKYPDNKRHLKRKLKYSYLLSQYK